MERTYRLGVFDRPVLKDWALWHGLAWAVLMGCAEFISPTTRGGNRWIDAPGVAAVTFFMIGWTVAAVRRVVRIARSRTRRKAAPETESARAELSALGPSTNLEKSSGPNATPAPAGPRSAPHLPPVEAAPPLLDGAIATDLRASKTLSDARSILPYPIARAIRATQLTEDSLEQHQKILDLAEAVSVSLGMVSASWLRDNNPSSPALGMLKEAYLSRGVSQGHWHEVARAAEKSMGQQGQGIPGFVEGNRRQKTSLGAIGALGKLLEERNKSAHGARPHNRSEAAVRIREIAPFVELAIGRSMYLADSPWILVENISYRRSDGRWNAQLRRAMGDHPEFDLSTQTLDYPLANDTFYVMAGGRALDLTPMLVLRYCDQCRQPEVCYADRVANEGVSLKSFARGHQVFDPTLTQEVHLLQAIVAPEAPVEPQPDAK